MTYLVNKIHQGVVNMIHQVVNLVHPDKYLGTKT